MHFSPSILLTGAFTLCALAAPLPDREPDETVGRRSTIPTVTVENLHTISADTASCSGASFPEECADATRAAPAINKAFQTYQITTTGEQAALVAYMMFESGNFKYSKNHYPGRPGQGTRMMAMPEYVSKYATSVVGADAVAKAAAVGGDAGLNAVLNLVNSDDEKSFGSAAWFLSSTCSSDIRAGLVEQSYVGWHNYLTQCVGTTIDGRDELWVAAKQALLGSQSAA